MTRRRWIADEFTGDDAALTGAHAAHLSRTLRARVGQQYEIACADSVRLGTITRVEDERVEFALGEEIAASPAPAVVLLLAIFKFDRMEWAVEKCTELNVTGIVPVIARRTEKHLAQAAEKRVERWRRIARESSEQSRRTSPPEIALPAKLDAAIASRTESLKVVLAESERGLTLGEVLRGRDSIQSLVLAVGSEGGWSAEELQAFSAAGWTSASLGKTILRAETAAIAALVIAQAEL